MKQTFEIPGRLDAMNEYTDANRSNPYVGARMKKANQEKVEKAIDAANLIPMRCPVHIHVTWIEGIRPGAEKFVPRDKDNIRSGIKYIQDALIAKKIIRNDSYRNVTPSDSYMLNRNNPRIIVEIEEV